MVRQKKSNSKKIKKQRSPLRIGPGMNHSHIELIDDPKWVSYCVEN